VKLSEEAKPVSERMLNLVAPPTAKVVSVSLELEVRRGDGERALTDGEWGRVVLRAPSIRLRSDSGEVMEHAASDGKAFTTRDLAAAIEKSERKGRESGRWLGGVDVHHVFFEGVLPDSDGVWAICWGS